MQIAAPMPLLKGIKIIEEEEMKMKEEKEGVGDK